MKFLFPVFLMMFLFSCNRNGDKKGADDPVARQEQQQDTGWEDAFHSVVSLISYDGERILES